MNNQVNDQDMSDVCHVDDKRDVVVKDNSTSLVYKDEAGNRSAGMMAIIAAAAANPGCDVEKMQALLDMQTQLVEREARVELSGALAKASTSIPQIEKCGVASLGNKGSYKYARWEDIDNIIRPVLKENKLSLSFTSGILDGNKIKIIGTITHANGQSRSTEMVLPIDNGPGRSALQQHGSTLACGKRYCAEMLLNIVRRGEDNDAALPPKKQVISAAQKEELVGLLQKTGVMTQNLLAWARCSSLDDMPASCFEGARKKLMHNLKEQAR